MYLKFKKIMKYIFRSIILLFLFSCKTSYNSDFVKNQLKADSVEVSKNRIAYIDAAFAIVSDSNNINFYTFFINRFPNSASIEIAKDKRKKLFLIKKKVQESKLDIDSILIINPCYTPIYKNIDYTNNTSFELSQLYNTEISPLNPYRNRYIIGDLNTVNKIGESRGVIESHFDIQNSWEFNSLFDFAKKHQIHQDSILLLTPEKIRKLDSERQKILIHQLLLFQNYYRTVGKYQDEEMIKKYSVYQGYRYTGQQLCFCEIANDTILLVSKHVTSSMGKSRTGTLDSTTNKKAYKYFAAFPLGKSRKYYAPHNRIIARNWERDRKYTSYDAFRDSLTGGGNSKVTHFDGKVQLPNFLLIKPDSKYPKAMHQNGIHEGSLSNMSQCMLGTPQSLGCFRTTDYGSKFSRWWIPNNANFFIFFDEKRYTNKKISKENINGLVLPFKNDNEGNLFRSWINKKYPKYAKSIDLEEVGPCSNCFIQLAWEKHCQEYIKLTDEKKLEFTTTKTNDKEEAVDENEADEAQENKDKAAVAVKKAKARGAVAAKKTKDKEANKEEVLSGLPIIEKYYIIIGCFKNIKNANSYSKKTNQKGHQTFILFRKNANCNLVAIGPYLNKEQSKKNLPKVKENINNSAWIFTSIK